MYRNRVSLFPLFKERNTSTDIELYPGKEYGLVIPMGNPEDPNSAILMLFQAST